MYFVETLKCIKCGISKELNKDNFYFRNDVGKWKNSCKICLSIYNKSRYKNDSENIKEKTSSYRRINKIIISVKAIIYNNKPEVKLRNKLYRQENKKNIRKKEKDWALKNPEKNKEIVRRKSKKQRQKLTYKIKSHVSWQIGFALRKNGASKAGNSVLSFLDYSIQDLKNHLENQFEPWMTWENYGVFKIKTWLNNNPATWKWQIDHIIPQSDLPYTSMEDDNFKKCWSLSNLRPYSAKQNVIDGATRIRHILK